MARTGPAGNGLTPAFIAGVTDPAGPSFAPKTVIRKTYGVGAGAGDPYVDPSKNIFEGMHAPTTGGPRTVNSVQKSIYDNESGQYLATPRSYDKSNLPGYDPKTGSASTIVERSSDRYWEEYDDDSDDYSPIEAPGTPAPLTDVPTSTTNYRRPRTVAAGWTVDPTADQPNEGTLTVVFRDGTVYNFYAVPRSVWLKFHASVSKGRSFLKPKTGTLAQYNQGPADLSKLDPRVRTLVYRVARTQQLYFGRKNEAAGGKGHYQYQTTARKSKTYLSGYDYTRKRVRTYGATQNPIATQSRTAAAKTAALNPPASKPTPRNTSASKKK